MHIAATLKNFKNRHFDTQDSDFRDMKGDSETSDFSRAVKVGAATGAVGALVGAGFGALDGRFDAIDSYRESAGVSQVELNWQQPVMSRELLGQIPRNERLLPGPVGEFGNPIKPTRINPEARNVHLVNPEFDAQGNPVLKDYNRTFRGYGDPNVTWKTHRIVNRELTGHERIVKARYDDQLQCQRSDAPLRPTGLKRWCVNYKSVIEDQDHGTYKTPEVSFEKPPDLAKKITAATLSGAAKGAGIGLLSGIALGVAGSLLGRVAES